MGGYGALRLGFKYPELFTAVTGNSPALIAMENFTTGNNLEMFRNTFGEDRTYYDESGPWSIAAKNADKDSKTKHPHYLRRQGRTVLQVAVDGRDSDQAGNSA